MLLLGVVVIAVPRMYCFLCNSCTALTANCIVDKNRKRIIIKVIIKQNFLSTVCDFRWTFGTVDITRPHSRPHLSTTSSSPLPTLLKQSKAQEDIYFFVPFISFFHLPVYVSLYYDFCNIIAFIAFIETIQQPI